MADTEYALDGLGDEVGEDFDGLEALDEDAVIENAAVTGDAATQPPDPYELLYKYHPEATVDYAEVIVPDIPITIAPPTGGVDKKHKSLPFLTIYERTKILGTRTNQLADGARPFVSVPEYVTDPLEIAKLELEQRRLPFLVKRPMPDGTFEYWRLNDLMIL
jgi:DNA-directed RNA polymerase subunit K/omega